MVCRFSFANLVCMNEEVSASHGREDTGAGDCRSLLGARAEITTVFVRGRRRVTTMYAIRIGDRVKIPYCAKNLSKNLL